MIHASTSFIAALRGEAKGDYRNACDGGITGASLTRLAASKFKRGKLKPDQQITCPRCITIAVNEAKRAK